MRFDTIDFKNTDSAYYATTILDSVVISRSENLYFLLYGRNYDCNNLNYVII